MDSKTVFILKSKWFLLLLSFVFFSCNNEKVYKCTNDATDKPEGSVDELVENLNQKLKNNKETFTLKIDDNYFELQCDRWVFDSDINNLKLGEFYYLTKGKEDYMVITIESKTGDNYVSVHDYSHKEGKGIKDNHITISIYPESLGYEVLDDLCEIFRLLKTSKQ